MQNIFEIFFRGLLASILSLSLFPVLILAQNNITRKELLDIKTPRKTFSGIKLTEITFPGGQKAPAHTHPCAVTGQILKGKCLIQVEGGIPAILNAGDAFYEPANKLILHFDNASETEEMTFLACYITDGDEPLIQIIEKSNEK